MALEKQVETPFNIDATYHYVASYQVYRAQKCVDVTVHSFRDEASRRNGGQPFDAKVYRMTFASMGSDDPILADIYRGLKLADEFAGASDMLSNATPPVEKPRLIGAPVEAAI